ncbi:MAG: hypothetical protein ACOY33_11960 [Pseudomonadota bacterium]
MPSRPQPPPPPFFREHGYGPERLATALARVDWQRPDSLSRARALIAGFVATCQALLAEVARGQRLTPAALAGRLVDRGDETERPLLWLVTCTTEAPGGPLSLSPARRARLEAAAGPLRAHARLLLTGELPAARVHELAPLDADALLALHWRELGAGASPVRPAGLVRLLKSAAHGGENRRALTARLRRLREQLATGGNVHARLDYTAFRALSTTLRHTLLFTPGLAAAFLDEAAQAAARPPSPDFDPLYFDRALADLAAGKLDHLDVDTLVLGADASPVFRARIVQALAHGIGSLDCADAVRERLIAAGTVPEICLVACAVARNRDDMRRALAQPKRLPRDGVLGEALQRFAQIARGPAHDDPDPLPEIPA